MFNALRYARKLEDVGVSRQQAEAHIQIMAEIVEGDLATKQDVKELKEEMLKLEYRLIIKLGTIVTVSLATIATAVALLVKIV